MGAAMIVQADLNPFVDQELIVRHFWEQQWSCRQEASGLEDGDMDEVQQNTIGLGNFYKLLYIKRVFVFFGKNRSKESSYSIGPVFLYSPSERKNASIWKS